MIGKDFLNKVEVFQGLTDSQISAVQDCCDEKQYEQDARLFGEGDAAAYLWAVVEGRVDLRFEMPDRPASEDTSITSLTEAMPFGWSSLVPPNKYRLSAYCSSPSCRVARVDRDSMVRVFEEQPEIGYQVMANICRIVGRRFEELQGAVSKAAYAGVEVIVHLATCGISAGARDVMAALTEEVANSGRRDIQVKSGRCLGKCPTEPNVTVKIGGTDTVVYQFMNPDKMRKVFSEHIIGGAVQQELVLPQ